MNLLATLRRFILPIDAINAALPLAGIIYEIGSGYGSLAFELARDFPERRVIGLDINASKIAAAQKMFRHNHLAYVSDDVFSFKFKPCGGVVMSDFLHHLSFSQQDQVITLAQKALGRDGILIIKEIDKHDGWRALCSRLWDWVLYPEDVIYYRSVEGWKQLLKQNGFSVSVKRTVRLFPGSTYLYICQKK